jgi:hypothetical protein
MISNQDSFFGSFFYALTAWYAGPLPKKNSCAVRYFQLTEKDPIDYVSGENTWHHKKDWATHPAVL